MPSPPSPPVHQPPDPAPSDTLEVIFISLLQGVLSHIGFGVLEPGYRPSIRTVIFTGVVVHSIIGEFYTIIYLDRKRSLICLTVVFIIPQAITKMIVFVYQRHFMAKQLRTLRNFYHQCEAPVAGTSDVHGQHRHRKYLPERQTLIGWTGKLKIVIALFFATILTMVVFSVGYPLLVYVADGGVEFPVPIFVPLVRLDTVAGITINWMSQLAMLYVSVTGLITSDLSAVMFIAHICAMADVLCGKVETMVGHLRRRQLASGWHANVHADRRFLCECIRLHQAFCHYAGGLSAVFYPVFTMDILTNFLSSCVVLFVWMNVDYFPLYGYMGIVLLKTFLICAAGAVVDMYANNVRDAFDTFPFYALPVDEQQKFVILIQRMQSPTVLMAGTFPLNMEMFVTVMKNSYSVAMILMAMTE